MASNEKVARINPRLNDHTFLSNTMFVKHNMGWLNEQAITGRGHHKTSNEVSPHNAFYVLPLTCTQRRRTNSISNCCFFPLGFALVALFADARSTRYWTKIFDRLARCLLPFSNCNCTRFLQTFTRSFSFFCDWPNKETK